MLTVENALTQRFEKENHVASRRTEQFHVMQPIQAPGTGIMRNFFGVIKVKLNQ